MRDIARSAADVNAAFESFFRAHHVAVWRYARRRTSESIANDVAADTFAVAWRRWDDIPVGRELPWLFAVARRVLANARRTEDRQLRLSNRLAEEASLPHPVPDATFSPLVHSALEALNDKDREALLLVAWEGLTPREAAKALEISYANYRVRAHRARRRLETALGSTAGEVTASRHRLQPSED